MSLEQPDLSPDDKNKITTQTWLGLGGMAVGSWTTFAGLAVYEMNQMYMQAFNFFNFGSEHFTQPPDSARNLIIGGVIVSITSAVPFFRGLRRGLTPADSFSLED